MKAKTLHSIRCSFFFCLSLILGCGKSIPESSNFFLSNDYPEKLSDWNLVWLDGDSIKISEDSTVYKLNSSLFSDYASKLRTLRLPKGQAAVYEEHDSFVFPVGTIISKTFFYRSSNQQTVSLNSNWSGSPKDLTLDNTRLIETRLLVMQETGWEALPYIWKGGDAYLTITGDLKELTLADTDEKFFYQVPSKNQCASCHTTNHSEGALLPIGLKARHLNHSKTHYGENQLLHLQKNGQLTGLPNLAQAPQLADFSDSSESIEARARAYLDINCAHCHNQKGPADTSALLLEYSDLEPRSYGRCKPPIATGRGSGGLLYSIVPGQAHESIMSFRLSSRDPAEMMPEIGRTLVHKEGVTLIDKWINSMTGTCV